MSNWLKKYVNKGWVFWWVFSSGSGGFFQTLLVCLFASASIVFKSQQAQNIHVRVYVIKFYPTCFTCKICFQAEWHKYKSWKSHQCTRRWIWKFRWLLLAVRYVLKFKVAYTDSDITKPSWLLKEGIYFYRRWTQHVKPRRRSRHESTRHFKETAGNRISWLVLLLLII